MSSASISRPFSGPRCKLRGMPLTQKRVGPVWRTVGYTVEKECVQASARGRNWRRAVSCFARRGPSAARITTARVGGLRASTA